MSNSDLREQRFRMQLLAWYDRQARDLPWRESCDPYRVWVSEIMLQQTRVAAVIAHYQEFLRRFPTVEKLAGAREASVLAAWSGLGYYRRGGGPGGGGGAAGEVSGDGRRMGGIAGRGTVYGGGDCQHRVRRAGGGGGWKCGAGIAAFFGAADGGGRFLACGWGAAGWGAAG